MIYVKKEDWFSHVKDDIFGGLVTSVALIPEVIGFAIILGVNPITALFSSVILCVVTSFTSGRPAMVSAAAGSMALVMVSLVRDHGLSYMIAATILAGILQVILGYLGIHKLMRFISKSVMLGFVNSLAILIFLAQIQQLFHQNLVTYSMTGLTILLMFVLPKFIKSIPPALIIIVVMTVIAMFSGLQLQQVGDLGDMTGGLPQIGLPDVPFTMATLLTIFPTALALAMVGLIESLLTLPLVNDMTQTKGDSQQEVKAQGIGNIITGFFGGQAGCAMIGQAVINVKSGGKGRLSTFTAGMMLFIMILGLKSIMVQIPTAALIGIMITVAFETFDWDSIRFLRTTVLTDSLVMLCTIIIVVYTHNLAIGILVGVIASSLFFISKASKLQVDENETQLYISGQLFFASTHTLKEKLVDTDLRQYQQLDITELYVLDKAGKEALKETLYHLQHQYPDLLIER